MIQVGVPGTPPAPDPASAPPVGAPPALEPMPNLDAGGPAVPVFGRGPARQLDPVAEPGARPEPVGSIPPMNLPPLPPESSLPPLPPGN